MCCRRSCRTLCGVIEAEVTARLGAGRWERSEDRSGTRNGSPSRTVSTPAGDVEVKIPKLRRGSFFPDLLEPRRRIDRALWGVIMTFYVTGTSTRRVDDLVKALGSDSGVSKSTVSRICADIDREVAPVRQRPLGHTAFPNVFLDATYVKVRVDHQVVSRSVVIARASPPRAAVSSSVSTWVTVRTPCSGPASSRA
jgi:putative transposase